MKSLNKKALKAVIEGTREERIYLCSKDFSLFFTYYFVDYLKHDFAPFHYEMFDDVTSLMDDTYREVAWVAFRESAKTSFAKGFLTWLICNNKRRYINVDSFSTTNAERILFDIVLELQTNPRIRADYGDLYNVKRNADEVTQKKVSNFLTTNGVRVEAHSTGKSVRGRLHGHQRPDFLLLDDFETNETKDSKAETLNVISHIDEFKAGLDSTAKVLYLCNYITEFGSVQTLIDRAKTDVRLKVRIVNVEAGGLPTWPAKYVMTDAEAKETGKVSLEDKKRQLGSQVYAAEMMNQPIDESTQEFRKDWFKYRTWEEVEQMETRKFATIDTAISKRDEADATGVTRNYVDRGNNWNIKSKNYRINSLGVIELIFELHAEGMEAIGIEEGTYRDAIEPFLMIEMRKRNIFPRIVTLKHNQIAKTSRIRGLIPRYEAGSVFHITGECADLEDQLLRFPKALHDDCPDSEAYQLQIAEPPSVDEGAGFNLYQQNYDG